MMKATVKTRKKIKRIARKTTKMMRKTSSARMKTTMRRIMTKKETPLVRWTLMMRTSSISSMMMKESTMKMRKN